MAYTLSDYIKIIDLWWPWRSLCDIVAEWWVVSMAMVPLVRPYRQDIVTYL